MPIFHAIAAMSENRVIGNQGKIPWHIPEDFRWFKHKTMGGTLIMGRKTFESIGKPLPGRKTIELTRQAQQHLDESFFVPYPSFVSYVRRNPNADYWICGGAQIYAQMLDGCSVLYLTRVRSVVEGDAKMPSFEKCFILDQVIHTADNFQVERWRKIDGSPLPAEKWPDLSSKMTPEPGAQLIPPEVIRCLYLADDWKMSGDSHGSKQPT